jgi:HD-GYP domain-containing protein (c-di-GMP phosphodiesterase class II)
MRRKTVNEIQEGDRVAIDIYETTGKQLLKKGAELTRPNIGKIRSFGIPFIYIEDDLIRVNLVYTPEITAELLKILRHFALSEGRNREILKRYNLDEIKMFAAYNSEAAGRIAYGHIFKYFINEMLKCLRSAKDKYLDFIDYRTVNSYLNFHAINAAGISMLIAGDMGMQDREIIEMGVGALLYDIKMGVYKFTEHERELDDIEKEEIKQHTVLSFDAARKIYGIPAASANVAYQHHERFDGSGYPKRLKGGSINMLSRIAAVADVYDALMSDRPHRKAYPSDEAWNYIISNRGVIFDPAAVDSFKNVIAKYLPGDEVELSGPQTAVVLRNNRGDMERPAVKIIEKKGKNDIITDTEIDLYKEKKYSVVKVLKSVR